MPRFARKSEILQVRLNRKTMAALKREAEEKIGRFKGARSEFVRQILKNHLKKEDEININGG